jgi:hypothetical protein
MQELHELHWKAAKHILRYVQGTITFGIHYAVDSTLDLIRFTDSDWVGDSTDHKSTSGYSLNLGSGLSIGRERSRLLFLFLQLRQSTEG